MRRLRILCVVVLVFTGPYLRAKEGLEIIFGTDFSDVVTDAVVNICDGSIPVVLGVNNETIVKLTWLVGLLRAEKHLVGLHIPRGLRIVHVSAHDLVACHHDVRALVRATRVPTVALNVRHLHVRVKHTLDLLAIESNRLD